MAISSQSSYQSPVKAEQQKQWYDIVVGIDGTGSNSWFKADMKKSRPGKSVSNSHVFNFVVDSKVSYSDKRYHAGTDDEMTGWDVEKTAHSLGVFIVNRMNQAVAARAKTPAGPNPTLADLGIRISIVGHSRGGLCAIILAKKLRKHKPRPDIAQTDIHFLGLYDAVDRHVGWGADTIPNNVLFAYHAIRDRSVSTMARGSLAFGNTGTKHDPPTHYVSQRFFATHSGIGGDPWGGDHPKNWSKDQDTKGSLDVDEWMRGRAKHRGLKFKEASQAK